MRSRRPRHSLPVAPCPRGHEQNPTFSHKSTRWRRGTRLERLCRCVIWGVLRANLHTTPVPSPWVGPQATEPPEPPEPQIHMPRNRTLSRCPCCSSWRSGGHFGNLDAGWVRSRSGTCYPGLLPGDATGQAWPFAPTPRPLTARPCSAARAPSSNSMDLHTTKGPFTYPSFTTEATRILYLRTLRLRARRKQKQQGGKRKRKNL